MRAFDAMLLEEILPFVKTPGQYVGGEVNMIRKDWNAAEVHWALAFPDAYTIGMSNLGIQILYALINGRADALAERVFTPWSDLEQELRGKGVPLLSLENMRPLADFDIIGFSAHTELCYTNILTMLDLAGIPFRSAERGANHPLICAGGHNANFEPVADFFDFIFIGEAEEAISEIIDTVKRTRGAGRTEVLHELDRIEGVYVPSFFKVTYDGVSVAEVIPTGLKQAVTRRVVADLDAAPFPEAPLVPSVAVVHDRISVEIMRGCPNDCRFCMSGNFAQRVRIRRPETVIDLCRRMHTNTGYDEIGLLSLSTGDYPGIIDLVQQLNAEFDPKHVSVSLPSLNVTPRILDILPLLKTVRRSGLTFAPETGSEELRGLLNKGIRNDDLKAVVESAYRQGWQHIKLYFMVGLPGENEGDIDSIPELVQQVVDLKRRVDGRPGRVNMTLSPFVPKPFTPFQWEPMNSRETITAKIAHVTGALRNRAVKYKYPDIDIAMLEGVFARGDRRLAAVIEAAWCDGARFDSWDECYSQGRWDRAFNAAGINPADYTVRRRRPEECLPWAHIHTGCEEHVAGHYARFLEQLQGRA